MYYEIIPRMTLNLREAKLNAYVRGEEVRITPLDLFPDVTPRGAFLMGTHGVMWGMAGELIGRLSGQPIGVENVLLVAGVLAGTSWGVVNEKICRMVESRNQKKI